MDRREFVKLLSFALAAGGAGSLASCGGCSGSGPEGASHAHLPFDVWREMREALRTSPDHLPARAERLVAAGDPAALVEFVRDEVLTYPSDSRRIEGRVMRWGTRATLRGGAGTPREKAELLVDLCRRAGLDAEIVRSNVTISEEALRRHLFGQSARRFAPEIPERRIAEWREQLGMPERSTFALTPIDDGGAESRRLAASVGEMIDDGAVLTRPFSFRWHGEVPIVRIGSGDDARYANLFDPDVTFPDDGVDVSRARPAPPATDPPEVEVTLEMALAAEPRERIELARGSWSLADLAGRQLIVQTVPSLDLKRLAAARFRDVRTFIPSIALQGLDLDRETMQAMSVVGDPFTRDGDRIRVSESGEVRVNDTVIAGAAPSRSATEVASLRMKVDGSGYPTIRLRADALDANGRPVDGLVASDFAIEEEGKGAGVLLSANRAVPRIAFLADQSGSMPAHYRGPGMERLVDDLSARVRARHPNAEVRGWKTSSHLWTWLGRAARSNANLIVYATDGHVQGELTESLRQAIGNGPPVVILNVYDYAESNHWYRQTFSPMAELTGGVVVPARDSARAADAIVSYLDGIEMPGYALTYGATSDEPGERTVTLSLREGSAKTEGSYVAPASRASDSEVAGLYLRVKVGRESVDRTLAGFDPVLQADDEVTDAMRNEALGALFGTQVLSFEGAAPPLSVWLDDLLTARLSVEDLDRALDAGSDLETLEKTVREGFLFLPSDLMLQAMPLHEPVSESTLTFEDGPRVMLVGSKPVFGADHVVRSADILPMTRLATAADDPALAFRTTLEKTARFAVAESELFTVSTRSLLAGEDLTRYREWSRDRAIDPAVRNVWSRIVGRMEGSDLKLMPADAAPLTFWDVDPRTGTMIGILQDGSGGGEQAARIRARLREIDQVMSMYNALLGTIGGMAGVTTIGGIALGVVAAYGQLLARLYAAAALAVELMDASHVDEEIRAGLATFACNVQKTIVAGGFGGWGETFSGLDYLISAIAGDESNPFAC